MGRQGRWERLAGWDAVSSQARSSSAADPLKWGRERGTEGERSLRLIGVRVRPREGRDSLTSNCTELLMNGQSTACVGHRCAAERANVLCT